MRKAAKTALTRNLKQLERMRAKHRDAQRLKRVCSSSFVFLLYACSKKGVFFLYACSMSVCVYVCMCVCMCVCALASAWAGVFACLALVPVPVQR